MQVRLVAVHAAVREQAKHVHGRALVDRRLDGGAQRRFVRLQARIGETQQFIHAGGGVRRGRELQDQQATAPTPEDLEAAAARLLEAERSRDSQRGASESRRAG